MSLDERARRRRPSATDFPFPAMCGRCGKIHGSTPREVRTGDVLCPTCRAEGTR